MRCLFLPRIMPSSAEPVKRERNRLRLKHRVRRLMWKAKSSSNLIFVWPSATAVTDEPSPANATNIEIFVIPVSMKSNTLGKTGSSKISMPFVCLSCKQFCTSWARIVAHYIDPNILQKKDVEVAQLRLKPRCACLQKIFRLNGSGITRSAKWKLHLAHIAEMPRDKLRLSPLTRNVRPHI